MTAAIFSAAIPEPFRILGLRLKPLSLGRYQLLNRFGCAFVADSDAKAGPEDLILGVLICSMRCDEFLSSFETKAFTKQIRRWGRKVCPLPWIGKIPFIGKWWRRNHNFNLIEKCGLFSSYIRDGSATPKYWDESTGNKVSGAHWSHSVEVCLRSELGWSIEEINEQPLTKALADYFKFAESRGAISLMTPDEIKIVEEAEKAAA